MFPTTQCWTTSAVRSYSFENVTFLYNSQLKWIWTRVARSFNTMVELTWCCSSCNKCKHQVLRNSPQYSPHNNQLSMQAQIKNYSLLDSPMEGTVTTSDVKAELEHKQLRHAQREETTRWKGKGFFYRLPTLWKKLMRQSCHTPECVNDNEIARKMVQELQEDAAVRTPTFGGAQDYFHYFLDAGAAVHGLHTLRASSLYGVGIALTHVHWIYTSFSIWAWELIHPWTPRRRPVATCLAWAWGNGWIKYAHSNYDVVRAICMPMHIPVYCITTCTVCVCVFNAAFVTVKPFPHQEPPALQIEWETKQSIEHVEWRKEK